ncbi:MAG TPA: hypothetical protein VHJ57_02740, partial [Nitrososphaeraceae archaeon]|nr:hypothetical protein [Nitrososphaeraceae archaeon]
TIIKNIYQIEIKIILGLSLSDKKELELLLKFHSLNINQIITFSKNLIPSQGNIEDFAYGFIVGIIIGNYLEKFFQRHSRAPDNDELMDIYFTLSLRSAKIRKGILNELT